MGYVSKLKGKKKGLKLKRRKFALALSLLEAVLKVQTVRILKGPIFWIITVADDKVKVFETDTQDPVNDDASIKFYKLARFITACQLLHLRNELLVADLPDIFLVPVNWKEDEKYQSLLEGSIALLVFNPQTEKFVVEN